MTNIDIPDAGWYVAGFIDYDADRETWKFERLNAADGSTVNRNNLCALKIENRSGHDLWIKLTSYVTNAMQQDACVGGLISSQSARLDNGVWTPVPPDEADYWTGQWVFLSYRTTKVVLEVRPAAGGPPLELDGYPPDGLAIADKCNLLYINTDELRGPAQDDRLYCFEVGDGTTSDVRLDVRNHLDTHYLFFDDDPSEPIPIGSNPDGKRHPLNVSGKAGFYVSTTKNVDTEHDPHFEILRPDLNTTTIVEDDGQLTSKPYAITPILNAGVYEVEVLNDTHGDVSVWKKGKAGSTNTDDNCTLAKGTSHTFKFSAADEHWSLHWLSGDDPKILVKRTDCPPPP